MPTGVYPRHHRSLSVRFWSKVDKTSSVHGCWLWTGSLTQGYGRFNDEFGQHIRAHRFSFELHYGPILDCFEVCHNCPGGDNPRCVNPEHLFLGTHSDNMRDARDKRLLAFGDRNGSRLHQDRLPHGTNHWAVKLSDEDIPRIRALKGIMSYRAIASQECVSQGLIWQIMTYRIWTHIP